MIPFGTAVRAQVQARPGIQPCCNFVHDVLIRRAIPRLEDFRAQVNVWPDRPAPGLLSPVRERGGPFAVEQEGWGVFTIDGPPKPLPGPGIYVVQGWRQVPRSGHAFFVMSPDGINVARVEAGQNTDGSGFPPRVTFPRPWLEDIAEFKVIYATRLTT